MTDEFPWDDPSAVITVEMSGEPVSKARARVRMMGGKVSSYTPSGTVLAERAVADAFRAAGFQPTAAWDFALVIAFRMGSWQRRDVDNLAKLVLDAATGIVWADDSQVRRLDLSLERGSDDPGTTVRVSVLPPQRPPTSPCGWCGKALRSYPSVTLKFCDTECRAMFATARRERPCVVCEQLFTPPARAPRVTCSKGCFEAWHRQNSGRPRKARESMSIDERRRRQREAKAAARARARSVMSDRDPDGLVLAGVLAGDSIRHIPGARYDTRYDRGVTATEYVIEEETDE